MTGTARGHYAGDMAKRPTLPDGLVAFVPAEDARASAEELADGRWVVAGRDALLVVAADGVAELAMWYQIQHVRWDGQTRLLTIDWVDPSRPSLAARTATDDPQGFMADVSAKVTHALVVQKVWVADSGTRVTASVRRREDGGLFSTLVADGPLSDADRRRADRLEQEVREGVGLD